MKKKLRLSFNAPAVLGFVGLCVIAQIISMLTGGQSSKAIFSVYRASLADPLTYVRLFTHVLGHAGWDHLLGNMMYILILGPMIEEKYGTGTTVFIVSQRASSVMNADMIIVLDDGRTAGIGSHDELLKNCKVYEEIYYSQFER